MHWRRLYNDNYGITQTYFYRIIELRPDILALFGYVDFCRSDDRDPGLFVAMIDTSGDMLTNAVIHGERINDLSDDFKDVLQIDSNHVLALTSSNSRLLSIRFDLDDENVNGNNIPPRPYAFTLNPAYPNPFNSTTTIPFQLSCGAPVKIQVIDTSGRLVQDIVERRFFPGAHNLVWNAGNVPSGKYMILAQIDGKTVVKPITLVK